MNWEMVSAKLVSFYTDLSALSQYIFGLQTESKRDT